MNDVFISAVIPAAGLGSRMNAYTNKNYITLGHRPVLSYTLALFAACAEIDEIIIAYREEEKNSLLEAIALSKTIKEVKIVPGGQTRQQSVYNGLCAADPRSAYAVIHDAARPFATEQIVSDSIHAAMRYGAACAAVSAKDTYVIAKNRMIGQSLNRDELYILQTPQTFEMGLIKAAHEAAIRDHVEATDDTTLVKRLGHEVALTEGSYENIKITTSEDLLFAELILQNKK